MQSLSSVIVSFPHGAESIPACISGRPVRFASIDESGDLLAWGTDQPPVLDETMGVWIADTTCDLSMIRTVGNGSVYPQYAQSMRVIDLF